MTMNDRRRIVAFGCSHTQWAPYLTWADILNLNGEMVINYAKAGHGNLQILMQLRKHVSTYGHEDFIYVIQPTYKSRLFDHYISQFFYQRRWFEVGISSISGKDMTNLFPGINLQDYLDDYFAMNMDAIHHFVLANKLENVHYIQIDDVEDERIGYRTDTPRLTEAMQSRKLRGLYLTNCRERDDVYRKPQGPMPNQGHCSALEHLTNAKLIADQLGLAPISAETEAVVHQLHDYYRSVEFVDVEYIERLKNEHKERT
jgi:hypothetical protein